MVDRDALRGPVDPATLGSTLMHEHLIWDIRAPTVAALQTKCP